VGGGVELCDTARLLTAQKSGTYKAGTMYKYLLQDPDLERPKKQDPEP